MDIRKLNSLIRKTPFILKLANPQEDIEFTNYKSFKQFVISEFEFWEDCNTGECAQIYNQYNNLYSYVINYDQQIDSNPNFDVDGLYNTLVEQINIFNERQNYNFYSKQISAIKIKEFNSINYLKSDGFIKYVQGKDFNAYNPYIFSGAIEAYNLDNNIQTIDDITYESSAIFRKTIDEYVAEVNKVHTDYSEKLGKIDDNYEVLVDETNTWKKSTEDDLTARIDSFNTKMEEIENLYNEKLRLESPAKYWSELEDKYRNEGFKWLRATVITSVILIALLVSILYNIPNSLNIKYVDFNIESLRSTLILAAITSVGIYLLRLFVKMAISAYHLSRDAKERYQLSYFYLSLINDKAISEGDRSIVLQSLFSRVDTGLLKGDSSPSFPMDGMVGQIIKNG